MTIDISPELEAQLRAEAHAKGVSVGAYVERLVVEENSRRRQLAAFRQAMDERLESLNNRETVDGEEVMARLIGELDVPREQRRRR
jgi:hypothetical protein